MENFFSTIAQVSFTIVGLFFVAITLDSETRDFWFGRMPYSRYTYLNFLIMLFPGFMSIGSLISTKENEFPGWAGTGIVLFFIYFWVFIEFRRLKKLPKYEQISELEYKLDIASVAFLHVLFLFLLPITGIFLYYDHSKYLMSAELVLRVYLSISIIGGVLPPMVFPRTISENKHSVGNVVQAGVSSKAFEGKKERNDFLPFIFTALVAFIIGWLFSEE